MVLYYDHNGQPLSFEEWMLLQGDMDYKRIAEDKIGDVTISTVWLGIRHNLFGEGLPMIFETMVFGGKFDKYQWRYATGAQAVAGHDQVVAKVRNGR